MATHEWTDDDLRTLRGIAERLGVDPVDMVKVMAHESGARPYALNLGANAAGLRYAVAAGLIQFTPAWLGCPAGPAGDSYLRHVAALSVAEQLPMVERFYAPHRAQLSGGGVAALYLCTFLPVELSHARDMTYVTCGSQGPFAWAYAANHAGFDLARKGWITVQDLVDAAERAFAHDAYPQELARRLAALDAPVDVTDGGRDAPCVAAPPPDEAA